MSGTHHDRGRSYQYVINGALVQAWLGGLSEFVARHHGWLISTVRYLWYRGAGRRVGCAGRLVGRDAWRERSAWLQRQDVIPAMGTPLGRGSRYDRPLLVDRGLATLRRTAQAGITLACTATPLRDHWFAIYLLNCSLRPRACFRCAVGTSPSQVDLLKPRRRSRSSGPRDFEANDLPTFDCRFDAASCAECSR